MKIKNYFENLTTEQARDIFVVGFAGLVQHNKFNKANCQYLQRLVPELYDAVLDESWGKSYSEETFPSKGANKGETIQLQDLYRFIGFTKNRQHLKEKVTVSNIYWEICYDVINQQLAPECAVDILNALMSIKMSSYVFTA